MGEWGIKKADIAKLPSASILLARCNCSKSQANQTDTKPSARCRNHWLEGTFQGETFQIKPNDTHIFYVCDHCQESQFYTELRSVNNNEKIRNEEQGIKATGETSRYEVKHLKSKFDQLQNEHHKLIAVTSELTTALQMNIIGQTRNIGTVLEQCKQIYPTLFESGTSEEQPNDNQHVLLNDHELEVIHPEEMKEIKNDDATIIKSIKPTENAQPQDIFLNLNLESLGSITPLPSPLTPETVRYVLETVFERIFELERCQTAEIEPKEQPLNKVDVEKIVGNVLNEAIKSPSNCGAGEGELSRPESVNMRHQNSVYINYAKLKADLMYSENEKRIRILQALRWRITKNNGPTREKVMESYANHDVLELRANISIPERLLLGYDMDHYVQESACRLINALASLRLGRDYLTLDERLLKRVLIKKVKDVKSVSGAVIRNMLVASVQKLSIRKQCRIQMVNEGLFEVIVDYMDDFYEKLSKYCLEYCSALLMNLCLVTEAKERSTKDPIKIVGLLRKFLECENETYLPYINGVMFSLFERSEIVDEALNQHFDKIIIKLIQITTNENIKKQLDFILQARLFGRSDPTIREDDDESKEEVDLLEVELDQDDFITQLPSGETLLQEYQAEDNSFSHFALSKDPPNSARSFSEETKQFSHKPSSNRGIFETAKPRRYATCSQNVATKSVKNKTFNAGGGRYPPNPICYMENCQRLQNGPNVQCSCSKCTPGQNRYYCGCYEAIRKDIGDSDINVNITKGKNMESQSSQYVKDKKKIGSEATSIESDLQAATSKGILLHPISTEQLVANNDNSGLFENFCEIALFHFDARH
ncbi:uncharacterized protein LOC109543203 isoform X2 [Dendroctonus ponderosae]|nr:uncharacterized protein LOC109543203 isoform X2 [Dendroctonus ponderosae]